MHIQDYKAAHSMPFLGTTIKLHMHSLIQDKACLWWQAYLVQGSFGAVHGIQVDWLIWLILSLACDTTCKV